MFNVYLYNLKSKTCHGRKIAHSMYSAQNLTVSWITNLGLASFTPARQYKPFILLKVHKKCKYSITDDKIDKVTFA